MSFGCLLFHAYKRSKVKSKQEKHGDNRQSEIDRVGRQGEDGDTLISGHVSCIIISGSSKRLQHYLLCERLL